MIDLKLKRWPEVRRDEMMFGICTTSITFPLITYFRMNVGNSENKRALLDLLGGGKK